MSDARTKFTVGDRVRTTEEWHRHSHLRKWTGVVTGYGHEPQLIRIQRDGVTLKGSARPKETYHMDFWEVDTTTPADSIGCEC